MKSFLQKFKHGWPSTMQQKNPFYCCYAAEQNNNPLTEKLTSNFQEQRTHYKSSKRPIKNWATPTQLFLHGYQWKFFDCIHSIPKVMQLFFRLNQILVDSLLQLSSGYEENKNLNTKLRHSHYSHIHKCDYCLQWITDGFDIFSGFDCLY